MTDRHLTPVAHVHDDEPPYDEGHYAPADWTPPRPTPDTNHLHDHEAEADVLAGILHDPTTLNDVTLILEPRDFHRPAHELIYNAILTLYARTRPVDITTVANQLATDLTRAGGRPTIEALHIRGIAVADPAYHAEIVREKATRRRLDTAGDRLKQLARTAGDTPAIQLLDNATHEIATIPRHVPGVDPVNTSSYARIDLTPVLNDILSGTYTGPQGAVLARRDGKMLLYRKAVHSISGEPGSAKSWCALIAAAQQLEQGEPVAFMDFEDNSHPVVMRLIALGADPDRILQLFRYVRPQHAFGSGDMQALDNETRDCALAVIDGITEAMTINGLSPNDNDDVANWLHLLPNRIADQGPAVLQVDHVVKNSEQRGRYAIGGQHKLAGITGAAYKAVVVKPFAKGSAGHSKIVIDKDKHGDIGPVGITIADLHVDATDASGKVYAWLDTPEKSTDEEGHFRPTVLMARVSSFLLTHVGPASLNTIKAGVKGKAESISEAVDALVREGYIRLENGPRGAVMHHLVETYEDR